MGNSSLRVNDESKDDIKKLEIIVITRLREGKVKFSTGFYARVMEFIKGRSGMEKVDKY